MTQPTPADPAPWLFPLPQRLELRGRRGAARDAAPREVRATGLPAEGFRLDVSPDEVVIDYADANGLRYARGALELLRAQATDRLPALHVTDWPDFPVRGYMLDISRNRVPTRETLARLVEILSTARVNQLQLYTEHTFAYAAHAVVWREASPVTADDVRWLDALCRAHGIELVANQNCFAHMERWLSHPQYRHRAELPHGRPLASGVTAAPTTLAPTRDNAEFVIGLLDELLACFTSRRVHIGCDEVLEVGKGVSHDEVERRGLTAVYLEHVRRIAAPLLDRGYEVLFWDDMVRGDRAALAGLPPGMTPVAWWYDAPHEAPGFSRVVEQHAAAGTPYWVAPGTSTWDSLVGRIDTATANLLDAAEVGLQRGARGYLVTDWGDHGHLQPPSVSFAPILYGAAVSWCTRSNRDVDVARALDRLVFRDGSRVLGGLLDDVGRLWRRTGYPADFGSPLHAGLFPKRRQRLVGRGDPRRLAAVAERLDDAMTRLACAAPGCADADAVMVELHAALRLARHAAWRLLDEEAALDDSCRRRLPDDLRAAVAQTQRAWLARSRPGGLADTLRPLEQTLRC